MSPWLDFFKRQDSAPLEHFTAYLPEHVDTDPRVRVKYPDGSEDTGSVRAWLVRGDYVVAVVEFWDRFEDLPLERLQPEYMS